MQVLDQFLHGLGIPYSYGFAIILLTIIVKLATFPLSKAQVLPSDHAILHVCPPAEHSMLELSKLNVASQTEIMTRQG